MKLSPRPPAIFRGPFMSLGRGVLPWASCLLTLGSLAFGQNQYVTFYSGTGNPSTSLLAYLAGTLQPIASLNNVSGGTFSILPHPDGTKFYLIANGGTAVTVVDGTFGNPRVIASTAAAAPTSAALQPDGRRLIITAGKVYIIDTGSDVVVNSAGIDVEGTPIDVAINYDSSRAFILSLGPAGNSGAILTVLDLVNNFVKLGTITFPGNADQKATGILMGPNGFLYLSAYARIYEIDPKGIKLTNGGELQPRGYPGKGTVTPDGKFIVFPNQTPIFGGNSVMQLDLTNRTFAYDAQSTSEIFTTFTPASFNTTPTKMYAYSASGRLYDLTLGSQVILDRSTLNQIFQTGLDQPVYRNLAFSNEAPPRNMWITRDTPNLDGSTSRLLLQANIRDQTIQQVAIPTTNLKMGFTSAGVTSGGTTLLGFNTTQIVGTGGLSPMPFVVRLVDPAGRGIYRGQVTFASANPNVVIQNPTAITGIDGYAQTFVTGPATPGAYTVTASAGPGISTVDLTLTVPGGTTGGVSQGGIFVYSGNGQIGYENFPLDVPMVAQLLDAQGAPLAGVPVTFSFVAGQNALAGAASVVINSDSAGLASFTYLHPIVPVPFAASPDQIQASSTLGNVTFFATSLALHQPNGNLAGDAQIEYVFPQLSDISGRNLSGTTGSTLVGAITIVVADNGGIALPNVGMRVTTTAPPAAYEITNSGTGSGTPPQAPPSGFTANCQRNILSDAFDDGVDLV